VYRFLVHMTGSIAVAEDLTQEVFAIVLDTVLHNRFHGFDAKKGTLEGYLLGIARNLARKEFGRRRRAVPLDGEGMMEKLCRDDQSLNGLVLRQELARLQAAIAELPSHYREVVVLCCLEDHSYEDAARIVECSVGTVASRISRAKQLLAAKLRWAGSTERMLTGREEIRR
jgi:RNA polymerase sigma-70 factor (ECF subfamily)